MFHAKILPAGAARVKRGAAFLHLIGHPGCQIPHLHYSALGGLAINMSTSGWKPAPHDNRKNAKTRANYGTGLFRLRQCSV